MAEPLILIVTRRVRVLKEVYTAAGLIATCDSLHRLALQAFEMATTPALRNYLEEG